MSTGKIHAGRLCRPVLLTGDAPLSDQVPCRTQRTLLIANTFDIRTP